MEKVSEKLQVKKQQFTVLYSKFGVGISKVDKKTFNGLFYGILPATNKTKAKSVVNIFPRLLCYRAFVQILTIKNYGCV